MAGRQWFKYKSDSGVEYSVQLSSNYGPANDFALVELSGAKAPPQVPKGLRMRYVYGVAQNGDGKGWQRRKFNVGTPDAAIFKDDAAKVVKYGGVDWLVTSRYGERIRRPLLQSTGMPDGAK